MSCLLMGRRKWGASRDDEGYRMYDIDWLIQTTAGEGPAAVMATPGLPVIGSFWSYGGDLDPWAFCYPSITVTEHAKIGGQVAPWWIVSQKFSNKPLQRCNQTTIQNPLNEPDKVGGSFVKYTIEATQDRFGKAITSSSLERYVGKEVEFDANRPNCWIQKNLPSLPLATYTSLVDNVNDSPMWGVAARCVKLSNATWERNLFGTCSYYYTVKYEFDINFRTFDRLLQDHGKRVLNGHWGTPGTGCSITLTTGTVSGVTGVITSFTITSPGSGYAPSTTIALQVVEGVGTGGLVTVTTNSSGAVTGVGTITSGGTGYTDGLATTTGTNWIIDKINNQPPNPNNPNHFILCPDLNGNPRGDGLLNGAGLPSDGVGYQTAPRTVQYYPQANLFQLNLPTSF